MKKILIILVLTSVLNETCAQRETIDQSIEWFALNSNVKIHKRFGLALDGQFRFVKDFQDMQYLARAGAEFYITPNLSVVPIGYVYVWNYAYGEQPAALVAGENRLWQQILFKQNFGRFNLNHRVRLEQRWLEKNKIPNGDVVDNFYLNRFRYRFLANFTVNKEKMEPGAVFINVWDEFFYGWGSYDTFDKIDQNRFSLGVGYQINPKAQVTAGAFYQVLIKNNGAKQENNTGILLQFTYNFDVTKKTKPGN